MSYNSKKMRIKLRENGKVYILYNDGSIEDNESKALLDKEKDSELINKIMDRFKHGFTDEI